MRALLLAASLAWLPAVARAAEIAVAIRDYAFVPAKVAIQPGDTVVWTNHDQVPHTITALGGAFASGAIAPGASFRYHFVTPGGYAYRCSLHPEMQATVVVSAPR